MYKKLKKILYMYVYTNKKYLWYPYTVLKNRRKTTCMSATFQNIPILSFDNFNGYQINYINFI